jgi:hypothetical protein
MRSSLAFAAAISKGRAQIHPTVYSFRGSIATGMGVCPEGRSGGKWSQWRKVCDNDRSQRFLMKQEKENTWDSENGS